MLKLRIIGFRESTGYGNALRALVNQLKTTQDIILELVEILPGDHLSGGFLVSEKNKDSLLVDHVIIHTVPEYFLYWYRLEKDINPKVKVWGYTTWETDRLPAHWPDLINILDGLFVPCTWNKFILNSCGVNIRIELLPHISEYKGVYLDQQVNRQSYPINDTHFKFYTIGVWNERKNITSLVTAFLSEFSPNENVSLVVKTGQIDWSNYKRRWNNPLKRTFGRSADAMHKLIRKHERNNIYHITKQLSPSGISAIHENCDCFISFTRGEGWGMGAYEAAWFGKPVAITKLGGQMDFLTNDDTFWLKYKPVPVKTAYGNKLYSPDQKWAEVDQLSAQKTMRYIYQNNQLAASMGKRLQLNLTKRFTAESIIAKLITILNA